MLHSVEGSTRRSYKRGWSSWLEFARDTNQSAYPGRGEPSHINSGITSSVLMALTFCAYLFFHVGLKAGTVGNYLSAVRFHLAAVGNDVSFLANPAVTMIRAGMHRLSRSRNIEPKGKLPFILEMILAFQSQLSKSEVRLELLGILVALRLAFSCLLRRSEYIPTKASKHWLRSRDVSFVLRNGLHVESQKFHTGLASDVLDVIIFIRSSKCDQDGKGFTFVFNVASEGPDGLGHLLMKWAPTASLLRDSPFFARSSSGKVSWVLSCKQLHSTMRAIAVDLFGFSTVQAKRFTSHSLRYGGASTLAAANTSEANIQLVGRWKSMAYKVYLKQSRALFERANSTLSNANWISVQDIRLLAI